MVLEDIAQGKRHNSSGTGDTLVDSQVLLLLSRIKSMDLGAPLRDLLPTLLVYPHLLFASRATPALGVIPSSFRGDHVVLGIELRVPTCAPIC